MSAVAKIAILGPNGLIGKDLIAIFKKNRAFSIYPVSQSHNNYNEKNLNFDTFLNVSFDAIINCSGMGDPEQIRLDPEGCVQSHLSSRKLVMDYLEINDHLNPLCLFISSGGIFNQGITSTQSEKESICFGIENLKAFDAYRLTKVLIECLNREQRKRRLIDVRVFGYVSANYSNRSAFFISKVFQCAKNNCIFYTDETNFLRDYVTAQDIFILFNHLFQNESTKINRAINIISRKPVSKFEILEFFKHKYGFEYCMVGAKEQLKLGVEDIGDRGFFFDDLSTFVGESDSITNISEKFSAFQRGSG